MKWCEVTAGQPVLGAVMAEKLIKPGVLLVGTVRRDGTARISGVEPLIMDGELWLSMMAASAKARDLARDPRVVLNSVVNGPEPGAEVKLRGTARTVTDPVMHARYAASVAAQLGWQPVVGHFMLFTVEIVDVTYIGYDPETSGQHVARWPAGVEYVRPSTTPTSLGPAQAVRRLLG